MEGDLPDLENRDPNNINRHVAVSFEDIFAEPQETHSADCVWINSYKCFNCTKNCCYKFLTYLCGILTAFCWACEFASVTFTHVWQVTPCFRIYEMNVGCCGKFYGTCVHCLLDPICEACGLFFTAFKR